MSVVCIGECNKETSTAISVQMCLCVYESRVRQTRPSALIRPVYSYNLGVFCTPTFLSYGNMKMSPKIQL